MLYWNFSLFIFKLFLNIERFERHIADIKSTKLYLPINTIIIHYDRIRSHHSSYGTFSYNVCKKKLQKQ